MEQGITTAAPSFNVSDEAAEQLKNCKPGDEFTASLRMNEDGSYEITSVDKSAVSPESPAPEVAAEEDTDEEKILGYKRPTAKRETPPLTDLLS